VGGRASGLAWAVVLRQIVGLPHFCTIPIVEKETIQLNHQPRKRDDFYRFFKRANNAMAAPPPPRWGSWDSVEWSINAKR
jgi:hypothetical protein